MLGCSRQNIKENTCDMPCPDNCQEDRCNVLNGTCEDCSPGFIGQYCNKSKMHIQSNFHTNIFFNLFFCKRKIKEWKKIRIIIQFLRFLFLFVGCENEMYGVNCKYHCSGHCLNNGTCNFITGFCNNGCSFGYLGDMCNESRKLLKVLKTHVF